jgi:hypothetical protein
VLILGPALTIRYPMLKAQVLPDDLSQRDLVTAALKVSLLGELGLSINPRGARSLRLIP